MHKVSTISCVVLLLAVLSVRGFQTNDKHVEKVLSFGETIVTIRRPRSIEPRHLLPTIFGKNVRQYLHLKEWQEIYLILTDFTAVYLEQNLLCTNMLSGFGTSVCNTYCFVNGGGEGYCDVNVCLCD